MRKSLPAIVIFVAVALAAEYFGTNEAPTSSFAPSSGAAATAPGSAGHTPGAVARTGGSLGSAASTLARAFSERRSDLQVSGTGVVDRVLSDDRNGDRHQRFILEVSGGQTVLVAHNIDLAPRVADIEVGDVVEFFGEYEWNEQGGVIHWTHHDPAGRHTDGWLRHAGRTYK